MMLEAVDLCNSLGASQCRRKRSARYPVLFTAEVLMDRDDDQDDHVVDESVTVVCPYCGEPTEIGVDPGGGSVQDYVEDCQVCCQPWQVHVRWHGDGHADVQVETTDG